MATYSKTGTTWTQQIVGQFILNGPPSPIAECARWLEAGELA